MRCVNDTLPPRERRRWLLITMRLSIMSFAGIVRTLVAVGTVRLWSMFAARVFGRPLSGTTSSSCGASATIGWGLVIGTSAGTGAVRGATEVVRAAGACPMIGDGAVTGPDAAGAGAAGAGAAGAGLRARRRDRGRGGRGRCGCLGGGCGGSGRARGIRRLGGRSRGGRVGAPLPVVLEDRPPGAVDGIRVGEVLLVHLVDEPFVGPVLARRRLLGSRPGQLARHSLSPTLSIDAGFSAGDRHVRARAPCPITHTSLNPSRGPGRPARR